MRSYTTIGDNNNGVADQHVISDGDIVGKYIGHVSGLGKVMNFLSSSMGFLIVIVLPMLLFFIYQVYNLIMISIRLKKAMAVENAEEIANARIQQEKADQAADEAARAKNEAQAALEEAKRLKEEAEALKAKAEKELKEARKDED